MKNAETSFDTLHVYSDGSCYVIAGGLEEAKKIITDEWCCDNADEAALVPDDKKIEIAVDGDGRICPIGSAEEFKSLTAAEWAKAYGIGMLCTEEGC